MSVNNNWQELGHRCSIAARSKASAFADLGFILHLKGTGWLFNSRGTMSIAHRRYYRWSTYETIPEV